MKLISEKELIACLDEMIEEAPGLCLLPTPFKLIRGAVAEIIAERDALKKKLSEMTENGKVNSDIEK